VACNAPNGVPCDDTEACTDDFCIDGVCDNVPRTGIDGVVCTCERPLPLECTTQTIPTSAQRLTARACRLFSAAVEAPRAKQRRRLARGARALRRAVARVVRAQLKGLSPECAAALTTQYQDADERASAIVEILRAP
jgi:hypothetical protein